MHVMKLSKTQLFILISSVALLIVLLIQINWIWQTAQVKEELFNEKANMVLTKTAQALSADKEMFRSMQVTIGESEMHKMDSLINHYMKQYNIRIDYSFEVQPALTPVINPVNWKPEFKSGQPGNYQACVSGDANDKPMLLKLEFPNKKQFVLAEMGVPFITSVILILIVMIMTWRTILSLSREKIIAERTTDFLNNMTHEFKTPLTNIALAGKMMIKGDNVLHQEKIKLFSGIILDENEKLKQQVEQVLSMTALERGEIPLHKAIVDFHALLTDCIRNINVQIENLQGTVNAKLNAEKYILLADKTHLSNALSNLLDNAIKYSGDKPHLNIITSNTGKELELKISDNGIGIETVFQNKVFDKFYRVPTGNVHNVKGFGLGLAYVKKIVELHSGAIHLESEPGKGTTFTLRFPYA